MFPAVLYPPQVIITDFIFCIIFIFLYLPSPLSPFLPPVRVGEEGFGLRVLKVSETGRRDGRGSLQRVLYLSTPTPSSSIRMTRRGETRS